MNLFTFQLFSLFSIFVSICRSSSLTFTEEDEVAMLQEFAEFISYDNAELAKETTTKDEAGASPNAINLLDTAGNSTQNDTDTSTLIGSEIIQYPKVPCAFNFAEQVVYAAIMDVMPHLRSDETFIVRTMQDFRYIMVVLKPHLGPLFRLFRVEYDFNAIAADCVSAQDFIDFDEFKVNLSKFY